jgi:ATP adenylyltransferase
MDHIWSPWRYEYLKKGSGGEKGCVFCRILESEDDEANYVVHRARENFVVLNRYPYTNGHAMVVPNQHIATLEDSPRLTLGEMIALTQQLEAALRKLYRAAGINIGMNIGEAAGAGVAGHIHMHVLPRWPADSNFMTVVGETRVLPEELSVTWQRLRDEF